MFYLRYRKNGTDVLVDAVEEVQVTAQRIGTAIGAAVSGWLSRVPAALAPLFQAATEANGLPPLLLPAVAYRESRFLPNIINGTTRSSKGAVGVMQILPSAHPQLGEAGALDPTRAIPYAAQYLAQLYKQFGTWPLAIAAYNWGPGNLKRDTADGVLELPSETRDYVAEVTKNAGLV
jgi:soluble lytic murein transglycosylase-like protein